MNRGGAERCRQLDFLYRNNAGDLAAAAALGLFLVAATWAEFDHLTLLAWLSDLWAVLGVRWQLARVYQRISPAEDPAAHWRRAFIAGAAASGVLWGTAGHLFLSADPSPGQLLFIFAVVIVSSASISTLAAVPTAAIAHIAPALTLLALGEYQAGSLVHVSLSLLTMAYLAVLLRTTRRTARHLEEWIESARSNERLRRELDAATLAEGRRMERFFAHAPGHFFTLSRRADGYAMPFVSQGIGDTHGLEPAQLAESLAPLTARIHADDVGRFLARIEQSARDRAPCHVEYRIAHPAKGERWIECSALLGSEQDGVPVWHGFMHDVTERKRMEEELLRRELYQRTLLDNFPFFVWLKDEDGRLLAANREYARFAKVASTGELEGKTDLDLFPRDLAEKYMADDRAVMTEGKAKNVEELYADEHGEPHWMETWKTPVAINGRIVGTVGFSRDITERKRYEQVLKERAELERQLTDYVASAPGFFFTLRMGADGAISMPFASPGIAAIYGLAPEDVADSVEQILARDHPDDVERILREVQRSGQSLSPCRVEFRVLHPDNGERWVEARSMPQRDEAGNTFWHGYMNDITERKQAEQRLRETQGRLMGVLQTIPDLVWQKDAAGIYQACNPAFERFFGAAEAEIVGKTDYDFVDHDLADFFRRKDREAIEAGCVHVNEEWVTYAEDGRRVLLETRKVPIYDADGKVIGVLGVGRDITERWRMEERLRLREQDFRTLTEHSPDVIVRYATDGRRLYVNPAWERVNGIPASEAIGKAPTELAGRVAPYAAEFETKLQAVAADGRPAEHEIAWLGEDGRQVWFNMRIVPELDRAGRVASLLTVARDVTERKRMEVELRQQTDMQQTLLSAIRQVGMQLMVVENGRIVHVENRELAREFGYTDAYIDARPALLDIIHPDDRERVVDNYRRRVAGAAAPVSYELGLVTRSGERREYETSVVVVPNTEPVRVVTVGRDIGERKRMAAELAQREREFRSLAENIPDNIVRWDTDGRYVYINPTHERTLGRSLADVLGQPIPDSHAEVKAAIAQVVATGRALHAVRQPVVVDGVEELHDVSLVPEFDAEGRLAGVLGMGRDMTAVYRLQDALAAREQEFRSLAESSPDFVIRYDLDGRIRYLNTAMVIELGLGSAGEAVGRLPIELWPDGRYAAIERAHAHAIEAQTAVTVELCKPVAEGEWLFHQIHLVPEFDATGRIVGSIAFGRDITELKRLAQFMQERAQLQERIAAVAEAVPGFLFTIRVETDGHSHFPYASEGVDDLFGLSPEEIREDAEVLRARYYPADRARLLELMARTAHNLEPLRIEIRIEHPEKGRRWIDIRSTPHRHPDGATEWHGVMLDITERKRIEEEVRRREREFRALVESSPDAIYRYDRDCRRLYVNPAVCRKSGKPMETFLGTTPADGQLLSPEQSDRLMAGIRQVFESGEIVHVPIYYEDNGLPADYDMQLVPELDAFGGVATVIGVAREVTSIRETERRLTRFAANTPGFFYSFVRRPDGSLAMPFVSVGIRDVFGIEPEAVADGLDPLLALCHPDDIPAIMDRMEASRHELSPYHVEFRIRHPDKAERWIEVRSLPSREADGGTVWHGFMHDVTERKVHERQFKEALEFTNGIINAIPDILFEMDRNGTYLNVWTRNPQVLAAAAEDLVGRTVHEVLPQEAADAAVAAIREAEANGVAYGKTLAITQPDGEIRWYEHSLARVEDGARDEPHFIVLSRDVTERKRMEVALQDSLHFARELIEVIPGPVFYKDTDGRYLGCNAAFERYYSVERGGIVGKGVFDLWPKDLAEKYHAADRQLFENPGSQIYETQMQTPDGRRDVIFHKATFERADGSLGGLVGVVLDITERKRMEEALQVSEAAYRENSNLLQAVLESSPEVVALAVDRDYRYLAFNALHRETMRTIWGTDIAVGMCMLDVIGNPMDREKARHHFNRAIAGESFVVEQDYGDETLSRLHWQIFYAPIRSENDAVAGVTCFVLNITERKRMEEALRLSEAQYRASSNLLQSIFESASEVVFFALDRDYRYLAFNRMHRETARRLWGVEIEIGMSMLDVFGNEAERVFSRHAFDQVLAGRQLALESVHQVVTGQGFEHWFNYGAPIHGDGGAVEGLTFFALDVTERKKMEGALRKSEGKLRGLYELSPLGIALTDMQGRYLEFNEAFRAICGYPADELKTLDYWTLTPREYEAQELDQLQALAETGRYGPYEKEYRRKDGTRVAIRLNGMLVAGEGGQDTIWSIVEDISERKASEAIIRRLHSDLQATLQAIPDLLFEMDAEGTYLDIWSQNAALQSELREKLLGKTMAEMLSPESVSIANAALREAEEKGLSLGKELYIDFTHRRGWFELSVSKKPGGGKGFGRFLMLSRDVTHRKEQEFELRRREQEFRTLVESLPDPFVRYDREGRRTYVSSHVERITGRPAAELLGRTLEEAPLASAEWSRRLRQDIQRVLEIGHPVDNVLEYAARDGRTLYYANRLGPVFGADGEVTAVMSVMRDVTELKAAEAAREAALAEAMRLLRARDVFMSQMSHELRTPLNGILGFAQLLQQEEGLNEEQLSGLKIIEQSGDHLLSLINDILDHAKLEADRLELDIGDLRLETFLPTIVALIRVKAEEKGLAFVCEVGDGLPGVIRADMKRLRQVLLNLLANAVKFTEHGQVSLRVDSTVPARLRFEVQDSGIGIPRGQLQTIFQPFEQAGDSSQRSGGTGLGLAISRKLVQLMGGDIHVESELGKGSLFSFELQVEVVEDEPVRAEALARTVVETRPKAAPRLPAPPRHELKVLLDMAQRGNMRNIVQRAEYLVELDPLYQPFADTLKQMARVYQSRSILELVADYLETE